jgi:hypothetical protein
MKARTRNLLATLLGAFALTATLPVLADGRHGDGRHLSYGDLGYHAEYRGHGRDHDRYAHPRHHRAYYPARSFHHDAPPRVVYGPPPVVYAPPRVVYAPPPVVYAPARYGHPDPYLSIGVTIPLH